MCATNNNPIKPRTTFLQKIGLIAFGMLCCAILLEIGLRLGGLALTSLQEHRNYLSLKQRGTCRILCLGESTTARQYPRFLEEELNRRSIGVKFSVIDKGAPGTNTAAILYNLKSYLDEYNPDIVITMMGINDGGQHMPYEIACDSKAINFLRSFRIYKLSWLLWLRIENRLKELKRIIRLNTKDGKTYIALGNLYKIQGRLPEAEAAFKKAMNIDPYGDDAHTALYGLYNADGYIPKDDMSLKEDYARDLKDPESYIYTGSLYALWNRLPEAETSFKKAIELAPKDDRAYFVLGSFYRCRGRLFEAEAAYKKAVEINPKNDEACFQLGCLYLAQGRFPVAEAAYKKGIELNPHSYYEYYRMGLLYQYLGMFPEAESAYKKAMELDPKDVRAYSYLGDFFRKQGRFSEAEALFKKAIELHKKFRDTYGYSALTIANYYKLKAVLDKRGITYVCAQYPMRDIQQMKNIFQYYAKGIIFVDNKSVFEKAIRQGSYAEYFRDMFGGNFGHCTDKGNRLLAENIADVIVKDVFGK